MALTNLLHHRLWSDSLDTQVVAVNLVDRELLRSRTLVGKEMDGVASLAKGVRPFYYVKAADAHVLERLLARLGSSSGQLLRVSVAVFPPDLSALPIPRKKEVFFRSLLPLVVFHNSIIKAQREYLETLDKGGTIPTEKERRFLAAMGQYYRLGGGVNLADTVRVLLERVDQIPLALALSQAAIESGWGSSRFCLQGNNLFGQRIWGSHANGLAPGGIADAKFRLLVFPTIGGSIGSYMRNLNTNPVYASFRKERRRLRLQGDPLDARILATTLDKYSTRGQAYIDDVLQVMRQNQLNRFNGAFLAPVLLPL